MSDNKYIIDKDSLTGIADAVRDKLGAGEATTDETTGEIVYPEDKGYYLKKEAVAKISGFKWSETGYNGNFGRSHSPMIEGADWDEAVGEPWYSAEITLMNVSGRAYNMDVYYTGNNAQTFTNVTSSTYTVSVPNGSTYFSLSFSNSYNPSVYNGSSSLGSLIVVFKDAEGKPIRPKQSSYRYLWLYSGNYGTYNFGTEDVKTSIPFSIGDIQNKITNYLIKGEKTTKAAMFFLDDSKNNEHALSVGWSGGWFINLNGSYASAALPNLRPENIQYILGYSASSSYYYYQYDPKIKALQHYTSYSESSGYSSPRIPGVTDYYFLANATQRNNGYTFGLACFDNGTDLDFQIVQKLSGSTLEGQLKTLRFTNFQPIVFFIIYKEA